jgi:hypothetical protein
MVTVLKADTIAYEVSNGVISRVLVSRVANLNELCKKCTVWEEDYSSKELCRQTKAMILDADLLPSLITLGFVRGYRAGGTFPTTPGDFSKHGKPS